MDKYEIKQGDMKSNKAIFHKQTDRSCKPSNTVFTVI